MEQLARGLSAAHIASSERSNRRQQTLFCLTLVDPSATLRKRLAECCEEKGGTEQRGWLELSMVSFGFPRRHSRYQKGIGGNFLAQESFSR